MVQWLDGQSIGCVHSSWFFYESSSIVYDARGAYFQSKMCDGQFVAPRAFSVVWRAAVNLIRSLDIRLNG